MGLPADSYGNVNLQHTHASVQDVGDNPHSSLEAVASMCLPADAAAAGCGNVNLHGALDRQYTLVHRNPFL